MTVIAWDGRTLAADRAADVGSLLVPINKIWRHGPMLMAGSGVYSLCLEMREWVKDGMDPNMFPPRMRDKEQRDGTNFHVIFPDKKHWRFEGTHVPMEQLDDKWACGSGRDYALAAMHLGCDARRAVEVAIHFDMQCGSGIDELALHHDA